MSSDEKKTECVKVWMDERTSVELMRLAAMDDRKLSEYINRVLSLHVFGHVKRGAEPDKGPERA